MTDGRVLVADDDATIRLLVQTALGNHGFNVSCAADGTSAWTLLQTNSYDLVLLDVEMPGIDGFTLCERIRKQLHSDVPVLLVTGHDDVASIKTAYDAGATDFISKPIHWPLLGHRLRYVLRAHRTLQSLDAAKARQRAMLRALPDMLLRLDTAGRLIEQHGQLPEAGLAEADHIDTLFSKETAGLWLRSVQLAVSSGNVQNIEYTMLQSDDTSRVFEARIAPVDHDEAICVLRDVTERREADQKIVTLAYFDPLTSLPNRASFQSLLKLSTHRAEREKLRLAVLFLDIDGFKAVNDTFGHVTGDHVLQAVAERLRNTLRMSDSMSRNVPTESSDLPSLSRLGGDEFTVLLPNISKPENAMHAAQRLCAAFATPFVVDDQEIALSTSVGISIYPDDAGSPQLLVKHADTAMYAAKERGRSQAQFYSSALTERTTQRFKMESALRQAMQRNEMHVMYQPIVDVSRGRIISFEALIRWNHPELGLLRPTQFIPIAEECGLIAKLGQFVLRQACADAARWNAHCEDRVSVAVNISALHLAESNLLNDVTESVRAAGLSRDLLEIEITESAIVDRAEMSMSNLEKLRDMGIRIALDDFGTGYSSLAYLREMPISTIKIDRTFVTDLPHSSRDTAIVRSIIALSQNFGLRVVGEGVELPQHVRALTEMGCNALQGYYFSKPVTFEEAVELLSLPLAFATEQQLADA